MFTKFFTILLFLYGSISTTNMNGPHLYGIANPNMSSGYFSTNFTDITPNAEFFDVYTTPITSKYADVYWTMMPEIPLSKEIVSRFNNKVMAVTGYEMDQVIVHPNGTEESIPCSWSYNHHYVAHLQGANSKMIKVNTDPNYAMWDFSHGPESYKFVTINESIASKNLATSQTFSSANGGESRGSFHGYPYNKAQLIHSPKSFYIQPMQIDTRNRDPKYINDKTNYHPGLLPKSNKAPPTASYSGLAGCPCTDRLKKNIHKLYTTQITGSCQKPIFDTSECYQQVQKEVGNVSENITINSDSKPPGCFFTKNNNTKDVTAILNKMTNSSTKCGINTESFIGETDIDKITGVKTKISVEKQVSIEISGPSDVWFGVAFNANKTSYNKNVIRLTNDNHVNELLYIFELARKSNVKSEQLDWYHNSNPERFETYDEYLKFCKKPDARGLHHRIFHYGVWDINYSLAIPPNRFKHKCLSNIINYYKGNIFFLKKSVYHLKCTSPNFSQDLPDFVGHYFI